MGLVMSLRGELVELLNVSDSAFVKLRQEGVVFQCLYYWLISAVHHLHYQCTIFCITCLNLDESFSLVI